VPDPDPSPDALPGASGLPDDAVVIRGGVIKLENLGSAFETCFREEGVYDISVCASAELDAVSLARAVRASDPECKRIPHSRIQKSTVGAIRAAGADVLLTPPPEHHYSVRFEAAPTDKQLADLVAAFDEPQPNPVPRGAS
jgi:hypothetical protein